MSQLPTWIKEIEERAEKAVPGPWDFRCNNSNKPRWVWSEYGWLAETHNPSAVENAEFISNSITDIPKLVSALKIAVKALRIIEYKDHTPFSEQSLASEALKKIEELK